MAHSIRERTLSGPRYVGLLQTLIVLVAGAATCAVRRRHMRFTDPDGFLCCIRCGQSLTPEGKGLGWLIDP
jgi:hypothetical protein